MRFSFVEPPGAGSLRSGEWEALAPLASGVGESTRREASASNSPLPSARVLRMGESKVSGKMTSFTRIPGKRGAAESGLSVPRFPKRVVFSGSAGKISACAAREIFVEEAPPQRPPSNPARFRRAGRRKHRRKASRAHPDSPPPKRNVSRHFDEEEPLKCEGIEANFSERGEVLQIENGTFFITGGGSGLGAATAKTLAEAGANVVLADVNEEAGEGAAKGIGGSARFVHTDVSDEASVEAALDAAVEAFGKLDGVVSCAGVGPAAKVVGRKGVHDLGLFAKTIETNLVGTFNVIRLAAVRLSENEPGEGGERGVIINTASAAAFDGQIGQAAYSASKGGVVGMTLPIARELASSGIRVMTIAPGIFETPMLAALPEDAKESLGKQVPFPSRLGRPDEYAALAKHIIENQMLNGEVIRLDGSIRMAPK